MSTEIIAITDADNDRLVVSEYTGDDGATPVFVKTSHPHGVYLTKAHVDRLRDALEPYGTRHASTPFRPVVGDTVRLLPRATMTSRTVVVFDADVTRVRIAQDLDDDGDYRVTALDGRARGGTYYVGGAYLAPLAETPNANPAQLDARRVEALTLASAAAEKLSQKNATDVLDLAAFLLGVSSR